MPLLVPPAPNLRPSQKTYVDGYNSIVSRVRRRGGAGSGGVVVFVSVDVDGLLATRILAALFQQDDVAYRIVPVGGYSELEARRDEALASEELHTLILLSLGSLLNLSEYFQLPDGVHLHIIDAHRPWNLDNLFGLDVSDEGAERIWVWGDGDETKLDSVKKSWEALEFEPSDSESDDEDEDEDEGEDTEEEEEDDEDEVNGDGKRSRSDSARPSKRRKDDKPRKMPRAIRDAHIERVNRYYHAGTSYGMSIALTVYLLATVLERADNDLLWLSILAVTHQYVAAEIDRSRYEDEHELLLDEVVRLNPEVSGPPNPDNRAISRSDEFRFVLFRHWNLYDSMLHSGYVAGRMGIWKDRGRKKLQGLLAKMGYSLAQCTQAYAHMDVSLKRDLRGKLDAIAPEYGLVELEYPSFVRAYGFEMAALSAADACEGLEALLEAAKGIRLEVEQDGGRGGGEWFGAMKVWSIDDEPIDKPEKESREQPWHVQNFWIAYDACNNIKLLRKSLPLAKTLHRAIIRQGSAILDKGIIRPLRSFRFAAIKEGPDLKLFSHPSTLSRLALWLVDATRDRWAEREERSGRQVSSLPFVIACLDEEKDAYMVVGVTGAVEYGDVRKNKFGLAFQQASEESGVESRMEMFDTSVVEVGKEDLKGFVEALHLHAA